MQVGFTEFVGSEAYASFLKAFKIYCKNADISGTTMALACDGCNSDEVANVLAYLHFYGPRERVNVQTTLTIHQPMMVRIAKGLESLGWIREDGVPREDKGRHRKQCTLVKPLADILDEVAAFYEGHASAFLSKRRERLKGLYP